MNNACPTCGAVYAVATKDIGRKIKCKKCNTALMVDDTGLVPDAPVAATVVPPPPRDRDQGDDFDTDDATVAKKKSKKYADRGPPGPGFGEILAKVGGAPTILFCLGLFFTVYFFFQSALSQGSLQRATGGVEQVKLEQEQKLRKYTYELRQLQEDRDNEVITVKNFQDRSKEIDKEVKKINKDYAAKIDTAEDGKDEASISMKRWAWFDTFGLMLGFVLLSFGCVGYLRTEQTLYVRIVAGVILCVMMMAIFGKFSGCQLR
jgi:predicted Zn finger-like uncharacterized protein